MTKGPRLRRPRGVDVLLLDEQAPVRGPELAWPAGAGPPFRRALLYVKPHGPT
jgi:hypothetical protein